MVEKYHSGGFNDPEAEGTPTFFLDGEVTSEIVVDEGIGLHVAVDKLIKEQSWFMMTPPDGEDRGWCLCIQFKDVEPILDTIQEYQKYILNRGLQNPD